MHETWLNRSDGRKAGIREKGRGGPVRRTPVFPWK